MWIMSIDDEDEDEVGNRPGGIGPESERKNEYQMGRCMEAKGGRDDSQSRQCNVKWIGGNHGEEG
jgi:hypothetical protein